MIIAYSDAIVHNAQVGYLGLLLSLPPLGHLLPVLSLGLGVNHWVHEDQGGLGDPLLDPGDQEVPGPHPVLLVDKTAHPAPRTELFKKHKQFVQKI